MDSTAAIDSPHVARHDAAARVAPSVHHGADAPLAWLFVIPVSLTITLLAVIEVAMHTH